MGITQNLSTPPAAPDVAPRTVVQKLPGEAQGMGDVSSLDGRSREPMSIPLLTVLAPPGTRVMVMGLMVVP